MRVAARRCALLVPALALLGASAPDAARRTLGERLARAEAIAAREGSRPAKVAALLPVARKLADTEEMGRRALGPRIEGLTPDQRGEFLGLFDELLIRTYLQKLLLFRKPRFGVGEPESRNGELWIATLIRTPKDAFAVDYQMADTGRGWRAIEIVVEGTSLTELYRFQFDGILRDRSFDELLDLMRRKTRRLAERTR